MEVVGKYVHYSLARQLKPRKYQIYLLIYDSFYYFVRVVGALEGLSQVPYSAIHIAVIPCRLHHLPYKVISTLEAENPALVLQLFKMMSLITARRQEATISQLVTLQAIMSAPSPLDSMAKYKQN